MVPGGGLTMRGRRHRIALLGMAVLLLGCHSSPPTPPPPSLGSVTFVWTGNGNPGADAQYFTGYNLACAGADTVSLGPGVTTYTESLPLGSATCTLTDIVSVAGAITEPATWTGTVTAEAQTVRLERP